ncbi:unnamed protein product [Blepharisma stoltei]|uniref:Cytochrome c oxidase assembly protein COX19 n=1 Tax=Blepharisma stoltei TaxID=1481888 RepID=A0AAU9JY14_9CILI|nr:unnamed protein product [Blepharisma stoltei]
MKKRNAPHSGPPDKGSFPLDHFQECEEEAEAYRICLNKELGIPKKCKEEAKSYLVCRMDKGLMAPHTMQELGFVEESTWEYEQKAREDLVRDIENLTRASKERVRKEFAKEHSKTNN